MSNYFPNNYPGARPVNPDVNAPIATTCLRQRIVTPLIADGAGAFQGFYAFSTRPQSQLTYGSTWAAGSITATTIATAANLGPVTTNFASLTGVSMEVTVRNVNASSAIQGTWASVNIPVPTTYNGLNYTVIASYGVAATGAFTDGNPAVRNIWQKLDESDNNMVAPGTAVATGETVLVFAISASAAGNLLFDIVVNYAGPPSLAGSYLMPSDSILVDDGAFARSFDTIAKMIEGNDKIITDPRLGDAQHEGYLRTMANYVAGTVKDGAALAAAVLGAVRVWNGVSKGMSGVSASSKDVLADMLVRVLASFARNPEHLSALPPLLQKYIAPCLNLKYHLCESSRNDHLVDYDFKNNTRNSVSSSALTDTITTDTSDTVYVANNVQYPKLPESVLKIKSTLDDQKFIKSMLNILVAKGTTIDGEVVAKLQIDCIPRDYVWGLVQIKARYPENDPALIEQIRAWVARCPQSN
jgi:hypothetical protein